MNINNNQLFNLSRLILLVATFAFCQALSASSLVYDVGEPSLDGGNNMGFAWQAQDFVGGPHAFITGVHFNSLEEQDAYRNSISWQIRTDAGSIPEGVVAEGDGLTNLTKVATGRITTIGNIDYTEYSYDFDINPLKIYGLYWLVLHNGTFDNLDDPNNFLWSWSTVASGLSGFESYDMGQT